VDVRILAASNEDLMKLVRDGRFREDLYHRLNVISLQLPPLRDRKEDIPLLVERFLEQFCKENAKPPRGFTHAAMKLLMDYEWPGNVRELENVVERAVVLSTQESVDADLLPENVRTREIVRGVRLQLAEFLPPLPGESGARATAPAPSLFEILEEVERRIIVDMLERTNWNQTEAAERFQIPLSTLNPQGRASRCHRKPGQDRCCRSDFPARVDCFVQNNSPELVIFVDCMHDIQQTPGSFGKFLLFFFRNALAVEFGVVQMRDHVGGQRIAKECDVGQLILETDVSGIVPWRA
jgi:hypothetical protein